jgi:hypothetical protein
MMGVYAVPLRATPVREFIHVQLRIYLLSISCVLCAVFVLFRLPIFGVLGIHPELASRPRRQYSCIPS